MKMYHLKDKFLKRKHIFPVIITISVISFLMISTVFIASTSVNYVVEMIYRVIPYSEYEDSEGEIKLQYPSNWRVIPGDESNFLSILGTTYNRNTFFYPPNSNSYFYLGIENLPEGSFSLKEYAEKNIDLASQDATGFSLISLSSIVLPTDYYTHGLQYEYESGSEGMKDKSLVIIWQDDDMLYYLYYYAEEGEYLHFQPTIQKMINSVTKQPSG